MLNIWMEISVLLKCNIIWKTIVCGWASSVNVENNKCLSFIMSLIAYMYVILKKHSYCKFHEVPNIQYLQVKHQINCFTIKS